MLEEITGTVTYILDNVAAYLCIVIMAALPSYLGARRSYECLLKVRRLDGNPGALSVTLAVLVPIVASCQLLGTYVILETFSEVPSKLLVTAISVFPVIFIAKRVLGPMFYEMLPDICSAKQTFVYTRIWKGKRKEIFSLDFYLKNIVVPVVCGGLSLIHLYWKHWTLNNILCLLISTSCVIHVFVDTFRIGCVLLGGLCIYEVFWVFCINNFCMLVQVFGTDVMGTVVSSMESPLLLAFPSEILKYFESEHKEYITLAFLDTVMPGLFVAFLFRFDKCLDHKKNLYFKTSMLSYITGLLLSSMATIYFNRNQPALLYAAPLCIGMPLLISMKNGDLETLLRYRDFAGVSP